MPATVIMVHDDPKFVEEAAAALRSAGHQVGPERGIVRAGRYGLQNSGYTRVVRRRGGPNGVALALMARSKQAGIEVVFTVLAENLEYTEVLGEFLVAPTDIPELATMVANTQLC